MLSGILSGLFVAFIASLFGFDHFFIQSFHEIFNKQISVATYYVIFAILGCIAGFLRRE